jgi:hypothetical protein
MPLLTELGPQQKDYLCGPFHAARVLRDHGVSVVEGESLDQDLVALRAGTSLPSDSSDEVPPGATSLRDYRYELPRLDREQAGTSARGLAAAIEELSDGRLRPVPLSGKWTADAVEGATGLGARLIANLRTGRLWGSRPPIEALLAALDGETVAEPSPADWDVGHFVELVGLVRGRGGSLVVVRDSYPSLGYDGVHLQPPSAVAAALNRDDGREGGVLAVVEPGGADAVTRRASKLGLKAEIWDN